MNRCSEVDDLIHALNTLYEVEKMPSVRQLNHLRRRKFDKCPLSKPTGDKTAKSTLIAKTHRDIGDAQYRQGEYKYASLAYTKCLAYAEEGSEEVWHAYVERSAALFRLDKYEQSQLDIDRALEISSDQPEEKKNLLISIKKERCTKLMAMETDEFNSRRKQPVREDPDRDFRSYCDRFFTNPLIRRTINDIKLEYNKTFGRHMIATRDIMPGEILSCDKYFSMNLASKLKYEHCSFCLSNCCALIPCPSCNRAMYCSDYCRTRAFNLYHRIECQIFRFKELCPGLDDYNTMALRMLLIGTDQGAGLRTLMKKLTVYDIFAVNTDPTMNEPFSGDYLAVLKLRRTFDKPLLYSASKLGPIVRTIIALQNVGYFGDGTNKQSDDPKTRRLNYMELFAALLLFNHTVSVGMAAFELSQFNKNIFHQRKNIGSGTCILLNIVNHSCDPNSTFMTRNFEHVLFSTRKITQGEQICISYGQHFTQSPLKTRQRSLSKWRFTCQCEACIEGWPVYWVLEKTKPKFLRKNLRIMMMTELKKMMNEMVADLPYCQAKVHNIQTLDVMRKLDEWLQVNIERPSNASIDCELMILNHMRQSFESLRHENSRAHYQEEEKIFEMGIMLMNIFYRLVHSLLMTY